MKASTKRNNAPVMRVQDMTQGQPLKLILLFAIPLFIGNIFQQIYGVADMMIAGHYLGDSAIAAIGSVTPLYELVIDFCIFTNTGFGLVLSQHFGAHREREIRQSIAGMLLLNLLIAAVLTAFCLLFLDPTLHLINTPDSIFGQAHNYISVIFAGLIVTCFYNLFSSILNALGNSRSPLYFLVLSCVINILLDIVFITKLDMNVEGAAYATVIAQALSAIACGLYIWRDYKPFLPARQDFDLCGPLFRKLASSGFSMGITLCAVNLGSVILQSATNTLGELLITANTAARKIFIPMAQLQMTIASANSTFIGQNWGAKKFGRIQAALRQVNWLEAICGTLITGIIFLFGEPILRLLTGSSNPDMLSKAVFCLRAHFVLFPLLGVLLCLRTAMQAMGNGIAPLISTCLELVIKIGAACWFIPTFGFLGSCITEPITWVVMLTFLTVVFLKDQRKSIK